MIDHCKLYDDFINDPLKALLNPLNLNYRDENRVTLMSIIAGLGLDELIPKAVELGYNFNQEGWYVELHKNYYDALIYSTPIHIAVYFNRLTTAKLLHQFGADVNLCLGLDPDSEYRWKNHSFLRIAMDGDFYLDKIRFYLDDLNINPNVSDRDNRTPLLEATTWNRLQTCKLLLDHGANVNSKEFYIDRPLDDPYNGRTPFLCALQNGYTDIIDLFVKSGKVDYSLRLQDGWGPLDIARKEHHHLFIHEMAKQGIDTEKELRDKDNKIESQIKKYNSLFFEKHGTSALPANYSGTLLKCGQCNYAVANSHFSYIMWKRFVQFEKCNCGEMRCIMPNIPISNIRWGN